MTTFELANKLINSSTKNFQSMSNEELKEIREFMLTKTNEINWILKGRAIARAKHSKDSDNNS